MLEDDREDFSKALATFLRIYGKIQTVDQQGVWFSLLKRFPLDIVRKSMMRYSKTGKRAPYPANLIELCESFSERYHPRVDFSAMPIQFNGSAQLMAERLIQDHGSIRAAEIFEESYPGHGGSYVRLMASAQS